MKYKVSLKIFSKKYTAMEITKKIDVLFDEERKMGDQRVSISPLKFEENIWILNSEEDSHLTLDKHIRKILSKVKGVEKNILQISQECDIVCQCIVEGDSNPELNFPTDIIQGLANISAILDIDLYVA